MQTPAPVEVWTNEGVTIIRFEAHHIDHQNVDQVKTQLFEYIDLHHPARVIANLRKVDYLHSVGIGLLTGLLKHITSYGGQLRLCSLQSEVHELLTVTHMHTVFECYDTEPSALDGFATV